MQFVQSISMYLVEQIPSGSMPLIFFPPLQNNIFTVYLPEYIDTGFKDKEDKETTIADPQAHNAYIFNNKGRPIWRAETNNWHGIYHAVHVSSAVKLRYFGFDPTAYAELLRSDFSKKSQCVKVHWPLESVTGVIQ